MVRWSPIQGCRDGRIAAARAQVLAAGSAGGVEDASFWQGWSEKVITALRRGGAEHNLKRLVANLDPSRFACTVAELRPGGGLRESTLQRRYDSTISASARPIGPA